MTQSPTNLISPLGFKVDFLAAIAANKPGALVMEFQASIPAAGTAAGLGLVYSFDGGEVLIALTPWTSLSLQPGDIYDLGQDLGILVDGVTITAEVDLTVATPHAFVSPTGPQPPSIYLSEGKPALLVVNDPTSPRRRWLRFGLGSGAAGLASDRTIVFDKWVLVITKDGKRTEIPVG